MFILLKTLFTVKKVVITNSCIIENCKPDICGNLCGPTTKGEACELHKNLKGSNGDSYHFHEIKEEQNKILIKKYQGDTVDYIKCIIINENGENKIDSCTNTTRHKIFTLSQKLIKKINNIIETC